MVDTVVWVVDMVDWEVQEVHMCKLVGVALPGRLVVLAVLAVLAVLGQVMVVSGLHWRAFPVTGL